MRARVAVSVALAVAVSLAVMGVVAAAEVLPAILAGAGWGIIPRAAVRWVLPIGALYLVLFLLMRFGPAVERSLNGRSLNTLLVIGGWLVVSAGFRWYVAQVADYTSMFGNLASVFVLMTYVYLSVAVFLLGVKLDALARGAHPKSIEIRNVGT
jgi:membrane protein